MSFRFFYDKCLLEYYFSATKKSANTMVIDTFVYFMPVHINGYYIFNHVIRIRLQFRAHVLRNHIMYIILNLWLYLRHLNTTNKSNIEFVVVIRHLYSHSYIFVTCLKWIFLYILPMLYMKYQIFSLKHIATSNLVFA